MSDERDPAKFEEGLRGYLDRFTSYPRRDAAAGYPASMLPPRRGLKLGVVVATATVAIVCVASTTTALVVTLHRSSPTTAGAGTSGGALGTLFIPIGGQNAGSSGQATGVPPSNALSVPQAGFGIAGGGASIYPYYNSCGGAGTGKVNGGQVEANGIAEIGGASSGTSEQLSIQIAGAGGTNRAAVADEQTKGAAVIAALKQSGVRPADITVGPVQLGNSYYYYGQTPSQPSASATITVHAATVDLLAAAADVAKNAGAAAENINGGIDVATPSSDAVAQAISDATDAAHATAMATASAAGLRLGKVAGVTTTPPSLCYGTDGQQLVVSVTVDYSIV
jgi:hypothetical protein